jgi:sirohydrochlorin ferrochelatase
MGANQAHAMEACMNVPVHADERVGIILVDHGSRLDEANLMLDDAAASFREATGIPVVEPAHMELAEPSIATAFDRCVAQGARHVVVLLWFLSPGRHSRRDVPELAREAATRHPGVSHAVSAPLGLHPGLNEVLAARLQETLAQALAADDGAP